MLSYDNLSKTMAKRGFWASWIICATLSTDAHRMLTLRPDKPQAASSDLRMFERKEQKMIAEGHRLDHSLLALRQPRFRLAVRDMSVNGMSALCEQPVE